MIFEINGEFYNVIINRKRNKNTYLRIGDDLNIIINTNILTTKKQIQKILDENALSIYKMIQKKQKSIMKKEQFRYLGKEYVTVFNENCKSIVIDNNIIYAPNERKLNKWYKEEMKKLYLERLKYNYQKFEENIPFPNLKIREMKTRWGVCNVKTKTITLNSLLFRENIICLDYVIIHELSHLIYFNHSKNFWNLVEKYFPNYKEIRKSLKE